jgi:hypothetical protein
MEINDFYFLVMVLGAFGTFAVAMVIATLQYRTWLRRNMILQAREAANRNTQPSRRHAA